MLKDVTVIFHPVIACLVRHIDMADFFSHENQSYPPSLSNYGALKSRSKADLLVRVSELVPHHDTVKPHEAHMVILDGSAIVNMIKPRRPVSFDGYIMQVMEYVCKQFHGDVQRVDMVFDAYWKDSLCYSPRYGTLKIHVSHFENGCHRPHMPNLVGSCLETRFHGT